MISTRYPTCVLFIVFALLFATIFRCYSHSLLESEFQIENREPGPVYCISSIPDYYQRDTSFGTFPGKGATYCGPVAVSNSLVWFSEHGFPTLLKSSGDKYRDQHELIALLGSPEYMNANHGGATVESFCRGLKKYLHECGVNGKIESEGMYEVSNEFRSEKKVPDFDRIKLISGNEAVWLNIGWYKYNPKAKTYTKTGGHWVTVVGYGYDNKGYNANCIIIHDPDANDNRDHFIITDKILSGTLINGPKYKQDATGFRCFTTGKNRFGVIGGVVYLTLDASKQKPVAIGNSQSEPLVF